MSRLPARSHAPPSAVLLVDDAHAALPQPRTYRRAHPDRPPQMCRIGRSPISSPTGIKARSARSPFKCEQAPTCSHVQCTPRQPIVQRHSLAGERRSGRGNTRRRQVCAAMLLCPPLAAAVSCPAQVVPWSRHLRARTSSVQVPRPGQRMLRRCVCRYSRAAIIAAGGGQPSSAVSQCAPRDCCQ